METCSVAARDGGTSPVRPVLGWTSRQPELIALGASSIRNTDPVVTTSLAKSTTSSEDKAHSVAQ